MFKSDGIKSFIISRIFGLTSLIIAIFLFLSLISFNANDISFGNVASSLKTLNYLYLTFTSTMKLLLNVQYSINSIIYLKIPQYESDSAMKITAAQYRI